MPTACIRCPFAEDERRQGVSGTKSCVLLREMAETPSVSSAVLWFTSTPTPTAQRRAVLIWVARDAADSSGIDRDDVDTARIALLNADAANQDAVHWPRIAIVPGNGWSGEFRRAFGLSWEQCPRSVAVVAPPLERRVGGCLCEDPETVQRVRRYLQHVVAHDAWPVEADETQLAGKATSAALAFSIRCREIESRVGSQGSSSLRSLQALGNNIARTPDGNSKVDALLRLSELHSSVASDPHATLAAALFLGVLKYRLKSIREQGASPAPFNGYRICLSPHAATVEAVNSQMWMAWTPALFTPQGCEEALRSEIAMRSRRFPHETLDLAWLEDAARTLLVIDANGCEERALEIFQYTSRSLPWIESYLLVRKRRQTPVRGQVSPRWSERVVVELPNETATPLFKTRSMRLPRTLGWVLAVPMFRMLVDALSIACIFDLEPRKNEERLWIHLTWKSVEVAPPDVEMQWEVPSFKLRSASLSEEWIPLDVRPGGSGEKAALSPLGLARWWLFEKRLRHRSFTTRWSLLIPRMIQSGALTLSADPDVKHVLRKRMVDLFGGASFAEARGLWGGK